jgi:DNA-binding GntR family transcriptional regulator
MPNLDNNSPVPMYYQIANYLRDSIRSGQWHGGDYLPPELELAKTFNVSRVTMRQALAELVKDGIISRQRGAGTVVSKHSFPIIHDLSPAATFLSDIIAQGNKFSSKIIEKAIFDTPLPIVIGKLQIESNHSVYFIKKLNFLNDEPISISRTWLPSAMYPGIIDADLVNNSFSSLQHNKYKIIPASSDYWIEAIRPTETDFNIFGKRVDSPWFLVTLVNFLKDGRPVEYGSTIWPGDRIRFHFQVHDSGSTNL